MSVNIKCNFTKHWWIMERARFVQQRDKISFDVEKNE